MNQIKPLVNSIANQPANPLAKLTDQELELRLKDLATKERKILHAILEHIKEFETRKLYLARAYSSVFEYLVKELGYSNSAAMRRLEAARLLRDVPIVAEKIKEGSINLSQIGELSRALKEKEKLMGDKFTCEVKAELVHSISGKTTKETQKELAVALDIPVHEFEKQRMQQDETLRIEITLNKAQLEKLQHCKNLASHLLMQNFYGDSSWATLFKVLADQYLNKRKMNQKSSLAVSNKESNEIEKGTPGIGKASMGKDSLSNSVQIPLVEVEVEAGARTDLVETPFARFEVLKNLLGTTVEEIEKPAILVETPFKGSEMASLESETQANQNEMCVANSSNFTSSEMKDSHFTEIVYSTGVSCDNSCGPIGASSKWDSSPAIPNPIADAAIHNRIYKKVTPLLRRTVLLRDGCCQYLDALTGKKCGSKFGLEVDHKTSQWAGGKHTLANLHTLCRKHNSYKYSLESGVCLLS
jgi:hypothetical protein